MENLKATLRPMHRAFVDRFLHACQTDDRVLAACLIGSYARGKADPYSDIDLMVITTDSAHEQFYEQRETFLRSLGELVFLEDFGIPEVAFLVYADGIVGELYFGSESQLSQLYNAPFHILLDEQNILADVTYIPLEKAFDAQAQTQKLHQYLLVFWHEMSHFITAMGRDQLWWAEGQLESLRSICVKLARLQHDFSDTEAGEEPYFKIENCMPVAKLAALEETFSIMDRDAILRSAQVILSFYGDVARSLAVDHHLSYPESLENVIRVQLEQLQKNTRS